jgi:tetraacyldisaccharide 4'-kinase
MRSVVRRTLEPALRRWWRGDAGAWGSLLDAVAAPAEWAFQGAVRLRNLRYDRSGGTPVEGLRVVSVGNLSLGGTGKTPLAAWATRVLAAAGWTPALLSRGYGSDELLLHRRWNPEVPVLAHRDRAAAAAAALADGATAVVLDDGFQHRRLARDVDLVLLAAEDPVPGRLLPRGPFREPLAALKRAHGVIVTRRVAADGDARALAERVQARFPGLVVARVALVPRAWQQLDGTPAPPPEGPILAVTSVARPEAFALQVGAVLGRAPGLLTFPDHHDFTPAEVEAMRACARERTVVVTEKDAVKLRPWESTLGRSLLVLPQVLLWEAGEADLTRLVTTVRGP